jgi:putative restriction endonuclease
MSLDHHFSVEKLSESHQIALEWFRLNEGREKGFPDTLSGGQRLATQAKGIYKPEGWTYALSIRVMLNSPYEDGEFFSLDDGGWICSYHQETDSRADRSSELLFTNRALSACLSDRVPIGVLQQIQSGDDGGSRYFLRGLGGVVEKIDSYFVIADVRSALLRDKLELVEELFRNEAEKRLASETSLGGTHTENVDFQISAKRRIWTQIVQRQGQGAFRKKILNAYSGRCCISGAQSQWVLDAAHILPYGGSATNHVRNGLLLRTDLHALFDLSLLGIEPQSLTVHIHSLISEPEYRRFEGTKISLPSTEDSHPSISNLELRWAQFVSKSAT